MKLLNGELEVNIGPTNELLDESAYIWHAQFVVIIDIVYVLCLRLQTLHVVLLLGVIGHDELSRGGEARHLRARWIRRLRNRLSTNADAREEVEMKATEDANGSGEGTRSDNNNYPRSER